MEIKSSEGFLVTDLECKELGSRRSILTSKKLNWLKNRQLSLDQSDKGGHRGKLLPKTLETVRYRESQPSRAEIHKQKPPLATSAGVGTPEL